MSTEDKISENKHKKIFAWGFLIFWVLIFLLLTLWVFHVEIQKKNRLDVLLSGAPKPVVFGGVSKSSDCQVHGPLPDVDCTPGSIFPDATKEQICIMGYTKTVRSVSTNTRKQSYAAYNISYPQERGTYEVDHLIPLALGGNNDIANLWPESAQPTPGFKEKDVVEVYLYEEVCAGRVDLTIAQENIAKNWVVIYSNLSQEQIQELKNKYKNWAN